MKKTLFSLKPSQKNSRRIFLAWPFFILLFVTIGLAFTSLVLAQTWLEPTQAPPLGQLPGPVWLQGASTTLQSGNIHISGNINISGVYQKDGVSGVTNQCSTGYTFSGLNIASGIITSVGSCVSISGTSGFTCSPTCTTDYLSKFTGTSTIGNSLIFDNGTNVGIGTATPQSMLHIQGNISTPYTVAYQHYESGWGANATRPYMSKSYTSGPGDYLYIGGTGNISNSAQSAMLLTSDHGVKFGRGLDSPTGNFTTEWMRINTAGNVGIGTTSPEKLLHLYKKSDSENAEININSKYANDTGPSKWAIYQEKGDGNLRFWNNAVPVPGEKNVLSIGDDGNVGIGTASPASKFTITGGTTATSGLGVRASDVWTVIRNYPTTNNATIDVTSGGTETSIGTSGYNLLLNPSGGNVGIGTTGPTAALDLPASATSRASLRIRSGSAPTSPNSGDLWTTGNDLLFRKSDGTTANLLSGVSFPLLATDGSAGAPSYSFTNNTNLGLFRPAANILAFSTAGTERMRIDGSGNVGIGTTGPLSRLGVIGGLIYTGDANTRFGAQVSGDDSGRAIFGSNLYVASDNTLKTFGTHASYGYSGMDVNWGALRFYTASGSTTQDATVTPTARMIIDTAGNVGIGTTTPGFRLDIQNCPDPNVGACLSVSGKINAMEFDPTYEIDGKVYATYAPSMTGLKEETVGKLRLEIPDYIRQLADQIPNDQIYLAVIDFNKQEKGSDLWLFRQITAFGENWQDLVMTLTPEGRAETWYELSPKENKLVVYGTAPINVSYRLIAPRYDWPVRDTNLTSDQNTPAGLKVR